MTPKPVSIQLPARLSVFDTAPTLRTFNADLEAAGIPKEDEQGRTIDFHALRHTFASLLARAGVPQRQAQDLLRHSDPRLTANVYQHLELYDIAGAVNKLPSFEPGSGSEQATGTEGAPDRTPNPGQKCPNSPFMANPGQTGDSPFPSNNAGNAAISNRGDWIRTSDILLPKQKGENPEHHETRGNRDGGDIERTNEHTSEPDNRHGIGDLFEALAGLSGEERESILKKIRQIGRQ